MCWVEGKDLYQKNEKDIIGQYISRKVLRGYLISEEQEVVDIMMALFDDEQILKAYIKEIKDNTVKEIAKETAERMIKKGKRILEEIADYVPSLSWDN